MWLKFLFFATFFGHTVFIKLLRECFSEKRIPTPYQPNSHDGGWVLKTFNIWYVWRSIYVSLEKVFHSGKLSSYSNSFTYILRKIKMEKCLKIFLGTFFRFLHCSNGTKSRLDAAVILIEFFTPKNSRKISASLICF